jgi:hypothetical protein
MKNRFISAFRRPILRPVIRGGSSQTAVWDDAALAVVIVVKGTGFVAPAFTSFEALQEQNAGTNVNRTADKALVTHDDGLLTFQEAKSPASRERLTAFRAACRELDVPDGTHANTAGAVTLSAQTVSLLFKLRKGPAVESRLVEVCTFPPMPR